MLTKLQQNLITRKKCNEEKYGNIFFATSTLLFITGCAQKYKHTTTQERRVLEKEHSKKLGMTLNWGNKKKI